VDPILRYVLGYIDSLPQTSFNEVRAQRVAAGDNQELQRRLSHEDRRAFAREQVRDNGLFGAAGLAVSIPAEQAAKALVAAPVLGPAVEKVLESIGLSARGRSGFHEPGVAISAGYSGLLQGLDDRGVFGRGQR